MAKDTEDSPISYCFYTRNCQQQMFAELECIFHSGEPKLLVRERILNEGFWHRI